MPSVIEYPAPDVCLLYLVRHGSTPHNLMKPPRLQGSGVNESLADLGREQAQRAAAELGKRPIRGVYTSPLKRAMETAATIAEPHSTIAEALPCLCEVNVGRWEDRTWPEIQAEDPEAYERYRQDPYRHGYPEGESGAELVERVTKGLEQLMTRHAGEEIVVVAHSVVNRLYLGTLLGVAPDRSHYTPQSNCGISTVRCKNGVAKVLSLNATNHLM